MQLETVVGFGLGTCIGTAACLGLWYARFLARVVEPIAVALNDLPNIVMGPLIIIMTRRGVLLSPSTYG